MPLIDLSPYEQTNGQVTSSADMTNAFTTIQAAVNGFENVNFLTNAGIKVSKLALPGGTNTWLRADGTWTQPAPNIVSFARNSAVTVSNTSAPTDLFGGLQIPGRTLGANGLLEVFSAGRLVWNGSNVSITLELLLGTSSLWRSDSAAIFNGGSDRGWVFWAHIQNLNSTGSQRAGGCFAISDNSAAANVGYGAIRGGGSAAMSGTTFLSASGGAPMTSDQRLTLRVSLGAVSTSLKMISEFVWVTVTN